MALTYEQRRAQFLASGGTVGIGTGAKTPASPAPTPPAPAPATPAPLPRGAFVDANGAEMPINNQYTNPNYAKDVATGRANAKINEQIQKIVEDPTIDPAVRQQKLAELKQQKVKQGGITPEMQQQLMTQRNLPQNQRIEPVQPPQAPEMPQAPEVPQRDFEAEKATATKMGVTSPQGQDAADLAMMTYQPQKLGGLIESGQIGADIFTPEQLSELGFTPERLQKMVDTGVMRPEMLSQLQKTAAQGLQAGSVLAATPAPTNDMMGILSEALNAKSNYKDQALGTSDLFSQAGLSGYEVLAQSLQQRSNEMKDKLQSASSLISSAGGAMASTYKAIADNYNQIRDDYNKQMDRLLDLDKDARDHEQAIELMLKQDELKRATFEFEQGVKDRYAGGGRGGGGGGVGGGGGGGGGGGYGYGSGGATESGGSLQDWLSGAAGAFAGSTGGASPEEGGWLGEVASAAIKGGKTGWNVGKATAKSGGGIMGAVTGAAGGAAGKLPTVKKSLLNRYIRAHQTGPQIQAAMNPQSTNRKAFDRMSRAQQERLVQEMERLNKEQKRGGEDDYSAALDDIFG